MDDNLLGYLSNSLDPPMHGQVEAYLRRDPEARDKLELLRSALASLDADRDSPAPPPDLVVRTLARVAEHACRHLPRSPQPLSRPGGFLRPFWRRADVLVAACLLLTAIGLGLPALSRLRNHHVKVECQSNLHHFYTALASYHNQHGKLPNFAGQEPRKVAGLVAPLLRDAGVLPASASIRCPANGAPVHVNLTVEQIQNMSPERFSEEAPRLLPCYAYSLGYVDDSGYHFPDRPTERMSSLIPLMADCSPVTVSTRGGGALLTNSPNHGGAGQNVLYHDGHVRFATVRLVGVGGDDIYLNQEMKVAPGIGPFDTVLAPSAVEP